MNNPFDLLALDVDGTLVGESGAISPRLRTALMRARECGVRICLCTGRPWAATQRYLDELEISTPPVVFNGALAPSLRGGEPLVHRPLPRAVVETLVAEARRCGDYLELHTAADLYIERLGAEGEYQQAKLGLRAITGPFEHLWEQAPILKAQYVIRSQEQRERIEALSRAMADRALFSWGVSPGFEGWFINVTQRGVEKSASLDVVLHGLGIRWERVLAAGDSPSDLAYVRRAGFGVIMGNAPKATLDQAPHVAPSVDEDGLAQVIEQRVLIG